jgi:hypothetical protein
VSSYDFTSIAESEDNDSPRDLRFFSVCCTEHLLIYRIVLFYSFDKYLVDIDI